MNKAVTVGVHRKLLSELAGECECVCMCAGCVSICVSQCVSVRVLVCAAELPRLIGFMSEDSFSQ